MKKIHKFPEKNTGTQAQESEWLPTNITLEAGSRSNAFEILKENNFQC